MLDGMIDAALKVYSTAGWLGVLAFAISLLVLGMITLLARAAKKHAQDAAVARGQVEAMHDKLLKDCMHEHEVKDQRISELEQRERELYQTVEALRVRVATLEALITKGRVR